MTNLKVNANVGMITANYENMVSTKMETNADHYLKDVFPQQPGQTADVSQQEEAAHMELLEDPIPVNQQALAKEDKFGILLSSNAFVLEELDGVAKNASSALEVKSGLSLTAAHVPKDSS